MNRRGFLRFFAVATLAAATRVGLTVKPPAPNWTPPLDIDAIFREVWKLKEQRALAIDIMCSRQAFVSFELRFRQQSST